MIAALSGEVIELLDDGAIVDVNGMGYRLFLSGMGRAGLALGERRSFRTTLLVREDSLTLYGFRSVPEQTLFAQLISVSGVGPKVALAILSAYAPSQLTVAIVNRDLEKFTAISGVGKKTAERIMLELKERLSLQAYEEFDPLPGPEGSAPSSEQSLAYQALLGLGFDARSAQEALKKAAPGLTLEETLKEALKSAGS